MSYRSGGRREHLTSRGYLEYLDRRLELPPGTIYDLCLASLRSKTKLMSGVKVTYGGVTGRQIRTSPRHSVKAREAVFLIEFKVTKAGKEIERVVQVCLET